MLAIGAPRRLPGVLANVPTWREQGLDLVLSNWAGVFGAKGLTPQQVAYWNKTLAATVAQPEWKKFLDTNQWEADYLDSAEFAKHLRAEEVRLRPALNDLGLAK